MSRTINSIEVNVISCKEAITLIQEDTLRHLEEVPFGNFQLELDLNLEVYQYSEDTGHSKNYVVHVNGNYAGYMIIMAADMLHHKGTVQATTDSFYIVPEYRSSGAFGELLRYIEQDLRENNIRFLTIGLNPNMPHYDQMKLAMAHIGYTPTEYSVTKELKWQQH